MSVVCTCTIYLHQYLVEESEDKSYDTKGGCVHPGSGRLAGHGSGGSLPGGQHWQVGLRPWPGILHSRRVLLGAGDHQGIIRSGSGSHSDIRYCRASPGASTRTMCPTPAWAMTCTIGTRRIRASLMRSTRPCTPTTRPTSTSGAPGPSSPRPTRRRPAETTGDNKITLINDH